MNKLIISNELWSKEIPKEEGTYLFKGELLSNIGILTVAFYPERYEYGCRWQSYYGILEHRGRNVQNLKGRWIKIEEPIQ